MGICFSEPPIQYPPPPQQTTVVRTYPGCRSCGGLIKQSGLEFCEACLQRNAMKVITPSAPPMQQYPMHNQYTYATHYPQQPTYYPPQAFISTPYQPQVQQYRPQQQQMSTATAIGTGFIVGALIEDMLDPTD